MNSVILVCFLLLRWTECNKSFEQLNAWRWGLSPLYVMNRLTTSKARWYSDTVGHWNLLVFDENSDSSRLRFNVSILLQMVLTVVFDRSNLQQTDAWVSPFSISVIISKLLAKRDWLLRFCYFPLRHVTRSTW